MVAILFHDYNNIRYSFWVKDSMGRLVGLFDIEYCSNPYLPKILKEWGPQERLNLRKKKLARTISYFSN